MRNGSSSYDGANPFAGGFLNLEQSGEDTLIKFDKDGNEGSESEAITVAILKNVQASSLVADNFNPNFPPDGSAAVSQEVVGTSESDNLTGGFGDDTIYGNGGNDEIDGQAGSDVIYGGEGDDVIIGNFGDDTLYGEAGNDTIRDCLLYTSPSPRDY